MMGHAGQARLPRAYIFNIGVTIVSVSMGWQAETRVTLVLMLFCENKQRMHQANSNALVVMGDNM